MVACKTCVVTCDESKEMKNMIILLARERKEYQRPTLAPLERKEVCYTILTYVEIPRSRLKSQALRWKIRVSTVVITYSATEAAAREISRPGRSQILKTVEPTVDVTLDEMFEANILR